LCIAALYVYAEILINRKIDETVSKAVVLLERKTGLDMDVSGTGFSLIKPEVYAGNIKISRQGSFLAAVSDCSVSDVVKIYLGKKKDLRINCTGSALDGEKLLNAAQHHLSSQKEGEHGSTDGSASGYSLVLKIDDMTLSFDGKTRSVVFGLELSGSLGKITVKDQVNLKRMGSAEIIFNTSLEKIDLLMNKVPLDMIRDFAVLKAGVKNISGTVDGFVNMLRKKSSISADIDLSAHDLIIDHPLIDWQPYKLSFFRFSGVAVADIEKKSLKSENSKISLGGIDGSFSAKKDDTGVSFAVDINKVPLNKLETLVHNDVFKGYLFDGDIDLKVTYSKEGDAEPVFSVTGEVVEPLQISDRLNYLREPFPFNFIDRNDQPVSFVVGEGNRDFIALDYIPEHVMWAVIVSEDAGFFMHKGVDFEEMSAAVKDNIKKKKMRGGSTITQQIAKNLFLKREKTLLRKFREVILAIELDATLSKKRLLEIYFNIVEWAPGIFGISNAAWYYFGKPVYMLTPLEGAYLASVIPGPYRYNYQFQNGNVSEKWIENLHRILNIMNETGHLTFQEYIDSVKEELLFRPKE
ncbi:MAG TPA: biosynthetic peptidoglycan transglycosylase, partial [bacterium]|nr:biosynthetic peptidoglycan transglycosylase [bacterium]